MWKGFILGVILSSRFSIWDRFCSSTGKIFRLTSLFLRFVLGLFQGFGCYPAQVAFLVGESVATAHPYFARTEESSV